MLKILITDDEAPLLKLMSRLIRLENYEVFEAGTVKTARTLLKKERPDILITDVKLPDGNGIDFTKEAKAEYPELEIIVLTAYGNIADGVQAIKNGAYDYLVKGNDNDRIIPMLARVSEKLQLHRKLGKLQSQLARKYELDKLEGKAPAFREAVDMAQKVAGLDTTVLLTGETGTGKEVFATAIHYASGRKQQAFVAINCSTFSKELLESELFGHKEGAFTHAVKDKKGLFQEADQGTLFLDEIGELPPDLQTKLLRVLETGEFYRVGESKPTAVNVRIIAATNRDLEKEMAAGQFREDLFYRLNVFRIQLPPLRERREDIATLATQFYAIFQEKTGKKLPSLSDAFLNKLESLPWKGNIRELKNFMERLVILTTPEEDPSIYLEAGTRSGSGYNGLNLQEMEKALIRKAMQAAHDNKTEAARLLGIGLTTLYRKLDEYQLG